MAHKLSATLLKRKGANGRENPIAAVFPRTSLALVRRCLLGSGTMIDFTRAFESAWERMMVILFQPFDLSKWFVIGFSAFLAGLLAGGNGFNSSYQPNTQQQQAYGNLFSNKGFPNAGNFTPSVQSVTSGFNHLSSVFQGGTIVLIFAIFFLFLLAFVLLLYWLGARGQFLLLDNIVRNRGAIGVPWKFYARPANAVFGFLLLLFVVGIGVAILFVLPGVILLIPSFQSHHWPTGATLVILILLVLAYVAFTVAYLIAFFLFREWSIPLMFRNGLTVREALLETWRLVMLKPGSTALFVLLRLALWIALAILSVVACCFTCCVALLPYLGTVVLLPALIYVRCFSLDCLAQFGPAYDVWTVDVPPANPVSPLPPLE
jgi:hypothetical protein